jgi:protoporphyrinogen oxidase
VRQRGASDRVEERSMPVDFEVLVIGAGPAGLTAAYCLTGQMTSVAVIEKDAAYVGGISRTVRYKDFLFDIGGHRFFSKAKEVMDLWHEILPDDFIDGRGYRASSTTGNSIRTRSTRSRR